MDPNHKKGSSWREYVAELNDGKLKVTEKPKAVHFKYPGLNISQYDREGNPNIVSVMRFMIDLRSCGLYIPYDGKDSYFCEWPTLKENNLSFIITTTLTFSRTFYQQKLVTWPLDASLSLGHVGNTSCSLHISIKSSGSQDPLASQIVSMVIVDKMTRQSKKLPDWFIAKYKGMGLLEEPIRVNTFSKPKETFHYHTQVTWSDTDKNDHTNFASYVQYAIDGIRNALQLKRETIQTESEKSDQRKTCTRQDKLCLRGISSEIMRNGLKSVKICFLKESLEGDVLDVHLWQEDCHELIVCCMIEKGVHDLCQIQLEYWNHSSHL